MSFFPISEKDNQALLQHVAINQLCHSLGVPYPGHPKYHPKYREIILKWYEQYKDLFLNNIP